MTHWPGGFNSNPAGRRIARPQKQKPAWCNSQIPLRGPFDDSGSAPIKGQKPGKCLLTTCFYWQAVMDLNHRPPVCETDLGDITQEEPGRKRTGHPVGRAILPRSWIGALGGGWTALCPESDWERVAATRWGRPVLSGFWGEGRAKITSDARNTCRAGLNF